MYSPSNHDEALAKAVAARTYSRGWNNVVDHYGTTCTDVRQAEAEDRLAAPDIFSRTHEVPSSAATNRSYGAKGDNSVDPRRRGR